VVTSIVTVALDVRTVQFRGKKTNSNVTFDNFGFTSLTGVRKTHLRHVHCSVLYTDNSEELAVAFLHNS